MPRANEDAPPSSESSAPSISDDPAGGLGVVVPGERRDMRAGGTLDILPDDLRQSMAELRQPQGRARAYRWLFVATVFLVASVFFVSEMTELYFGGLPEYREEMGLRALNQSSACNTPVQAHSQHAIETFIGALPGTARTFLLTVLATTLCRKITAARNQDGSSLAAALLVVGTDGDADTIRRAGWDAIVGALESDLPDEGSSNPQSSWTQAREARKLTQRQAISSAVAKLLLWHWSQPVVYLWMLFVYRCYVASLGLSQMRFAAIVAVREVLYLGSTLLATWQCPVFLLMDPITAWREAENRLEKVMRAAMYVLTPHNYTALCLANRFRSWQRVFLGLAGIQVIADLASCFALAAILAGADGDNTPTALIIGYVLTAFGFLLFFGPLSVVTSLRGAADRTKHSCKRLGLGLSGISLLVALVYIVVLYLAMISVGFNPLCRGFIGTAADPCTPPARCVWAGECIYRSPQFPNSRIVTPEWASTLSNWTGRLDREWSLCCSTFEGCDTAAKFHAACDAHTPTLTVARNSGDGEVNPGNFTFGGFAAGSWSVDACCAVAGNACHRPTNDYCIDHTSSSDWLFGLWPGPPQRFEPTGKNNDYQGVQVATWPQWGWQENDLAIGTTWDGAPGGSHGRCTQGRAYGTYQGTNGAICGGTDNWGATDVEVWHSR